VRGEIKNNALYGDDIRKFCIVNRITSCLMRIKPTKENEEM